MSTYWNERTAIQAEEVYCNLAEAPLKAMPEPAVNPLADEELLDDPFADQ